MTEPTCNDSETTKPLTDRLRAAATGESFQLHWLVEAAKEIDRLGLMLRMIEEAAPDEWSRNLARKARTGTAEKS